MSAITYHFGGKRGLYLAAAENIARSMREVLAVGDLSDGPDNARGQLHEILNRLADKMLSDQSGGWSLFIAREQLRPSKAFTCFYDDAIGQSISRLATLIELSTGAAPDVARLTAALLFGHVTALCSTRATLLRVLERPTMDEESAMSFKSRVADNTNAILDKLAIRISVR